MRDARCHRLAVFRAFARWVGVLVLLVGLLVLAGWVFDIAALKRVFPGLVNMKANTALGFILAGLALWSAAAEQASPGQRRLGQVGALLAGLLGLGTLGEYLLGWDLGIDQLLFRDASPAVGGLLPGRMALSTALNFSMVGMALLLLDRRRGSLPAQVLALAATLVTLLPLAGYFYSVEALYRSGPYTAMALHTVLGFVLLCTGVLAARPERGLAAILVSETLGGKLARRLLPVVVLVPLGLGWLCLQGERQGIYETEFGMALFALANVTVLAVFIFATSKALERLDTHRQEGEQRYRVLFERSPDGISLIDPATALPHEFNDVACRQLGYSHAEFARLRISDYEFTEAPEETAAHIEKVLREGRDTFETRHRTKGGEIREVLVMAQTIELSGRVLFYCIFRDITERRQAEERVQRALRREQALSRIRDRITGLRHLTEVPGELEEAWVGELRGLDIPINRVSLQFPSSSEGCFTTYRDAFLSEVKSVDNRLADYPWVGEVWASGKPVLVSRQRLEQAGFPPEERSLVEVPLPGGGSLGVNSEEEDAFDEEAVQVLEQVAGLLALGLERLKDFEILRQAEEQLKINLAVQQVRNEILLMRGVEDWRKVVVVFEQELRKVIAFKDCGINLLDHQRHSYLDYEVTTGTIMEKKYTTLPRSLAQALDTGQPVYRRNRAEVDQLEDPIKAGTNCVLDVPFAGGTVAINSSDEDAFSARDIQVLERFAQVMSEAYRRLEDLKNLALQEEHLHQAQKLEAIGQLATGVAHEINNPLTSVLGYSELLLRHKLDPQVREHLETIHQEGERAQEIAARLLQFVRRQKASTQPLSLNLLVEEVLVLARQQFELDHVQLTFALEPDLPLVQGQPGQLQQLLLALLQNSREAIIKSGNAGAIKVGTRRQGNQVQLVVEDDGPGIPEQVRERIFEPFFTTKEVGKGVGTGMGLSLCYTIAREHSGRLWAEPRTAGACLVLELPAGAGAVESTAKEAM